MNSRREKLLSLVYATRPLTQKATRNPRIKTREVVAYVLIFAFFSAAVAVFLHWQISIHYQKEMASWRARQSTLADDQAQRIEDWLKERQGDAQVLAGAPAIRSVLCHINRKVTSTLTAHPRLRRC